ncbi:MAG: 2'-5' RNA ligase family protein [Nocardioides sp.]
MHSAAPAPGTEAGSTVDSVIGVALSLPEPWATQLQEYRTAIGDVTASLIPTHITLVPPVRIADEARSAIESHLGDVAASREPFGIHLRGTGTFRPVSPVVFVALADGIADCEQLAKSVRSGPLTTDLRFPYHPHVTIAQDLDDVALDRAFDELAGFECRFIADGFHMYSHDRDEGWRPTRSFTLGV